ncbi:MAG TPA: hypothetical protein VN380_01235 [Thermoanaerobaculia bacterium]|nr:hypothetical protein [Thermoanaerobaculia bacterium]
MRRASAFCFLLSAFVATSACAVAAPLKHPVVVWTDEAHAQPYFVEDSAIDLLPPAAREEITSALVTARKQEEEFANTARANGLNVSRCGPETVGDSLTSANAVDVLRSLPIVASGRIVDVVTGWNVPRHRVSSLVFVRVEEVWKGGGVAADDILIVELPFGTFHHRGATWCTEMTGSDRMIPGRPILISGRLEPKRTPLTLLGTAWPIENDHALPPHASPIALHTLRNSIR